jgi:hypothetical protein
MWVRQETFGLHNMLGIFWLPDQLLISQGRTYGISELSLKVTLHQLVVIFMGKMRCGTEGQGGEGENVFINVVVNCQDYTASVVELNTIIRTREKLCTWRWTCRSATLSATNPTRTGHVSQSLDGQSVHTGPKCHEITKLINRHKGEIGYVVTTHNGKMVRRQSSRYMASSAMIYRIWLPTMVTTVHFNDPPKAIYYSKWADHLKQVRIKVDPNSGIYGHTNTV